MAKLDLEACRAMGLAAARAQPAVAAHQRLLQALHPIAPARALRALQAQGPSAGTYGQDHDHSTLTQIDLRRMDPEMQAAAARFGLSLPLLALIAQEAVGYAAPDPKDHTISAEEHAFTEQLYRVTRTYVRRFYMHPFMQAKGMVTLDPFTGERLVSTHAFPSDALHILYRFEGLETFYLGIGAINGAVRFIGIPRLNCIVTMPAPGEDDGHVRWGIKVYQHAMARIMARAAEMEAIFRAPRTKTGIMLGFWPNFGHYLWQEISGLQEIIDVHGPQAISHLLIGPHSDFNIPEVFPELAGVPIQHLQSAAGVFDATYRTDAQHIRPIGMLIQPALRERLARAAERHTPQALKARIAETASRRFLVWVTLRKNKKVWLRQVEGHAEVLRRLAQDVGPMAVVIDGWTNTQDDADALRARLEPEIEVVSILGCGVYESYLWARAAHVYSNVVGSGLFMNTYFACRPGVAHANTRHLDQAKYWALQSPGSCEPVFFTRAETRGDNDLMADYDFDPELLYLKLRGVVRQHYPDRLRTPHDSSEVQPHQPAPAPSTGSAAPKPVLSPGLSLRRMADAGGLADAVRLFAGATLPRTTPFFAQAPNPAMAPHAGVMLDPASRSYEAPPILAGALDGATMLHLEGIVLAGGTVLADTYYGSSLDGPERPQQTQARETAARQLAQGTERLPGHGFGGFMNHWQSQGHWMVGGLARMVAFAHLRQRHPGMKLILPQSPPTSLSGQIMAQALPLLGIAPADVYYLPEDRTVSFDTLWAMSELSPWAVSPVTHQAAQYLAGRLAAAPGEGLGERLFLTPPPGTLANHEDVAALLARRGFAVANVERMDLAQRIRAFRRARHVVGLHGWPLAGILFCPPGGALLELFGPTQAQPMYWSVASRSGIRYGYVCGQRPAGAGQAPPGAPQPFVVETGPLTAAVDAMLASG